MIQLQAIKGPTGRLLKEMLEERGLMQGEVKALINYGYASCDDDLPALNKKAGTVNKYEELVKIDAAGVRTVPFSLRMDDYDPPIFGRKFHHTRGTDIQVFRVVHCLPRQKELCDYYTQMIPKQAEYRVWVFRSKALATYEKVLDYPHKNGRAGRNKEIWNWRNGYAYKFLEPENVQIGLKNIAIDAVEALGLDFGAVDVILGTNHKLYVLEVNTAPGVEGRRQGITSLVNCIQKWTERGFKPRKAGTE